MSTFTLAISCLTTSNLPWFMDLTVQVPVQYCSLQHWTLLLSPVISTTGYCFCFGSITSFFLELFLHWSPVAYWAPTDLGSSSFSILSVCLSYYSWDSQGKNTGVVCHSLLPAYLTYMQSTSWEMPGWKKHKLESRLPEEISITSDRQMTPSLWKKVKRNYKSSWWKWKRRVKKLA